MNKIFSISSVWRYRYLGISIDVFLILVFFILSFHIAFAYYGYTRLKPSFYQKHYAPSLSYACGKGLTNFRYNDYPEIREFFKLKTDSFDCSNFPNDIKPLNFTRHQNGARYLYIAVAIVWSVFGISWSNVAWLSAFLFALSIVGAYVLARQLLPKSWGVLATLLFLFSANNLNQMVHLRDYVKAPFFLLCFALTAYLVQSKATLKKSIALCALTGVICGVGYGARMDILLFIIFFPFAIIIFLQADFKKGLLIKGVGCLAFLVSFYITAWPIISNISKTGGVGPWHVIALGQTTHFDNSLYIQNSLYNFGRFYNDGYIASSFQRSGQVNSGQKIERKHYLDEEYANYGKSYIQEWLITFPADVFTRMLGAILAVFSSTTKGGSLYLENPTNNLEILASVVSKISLLKQTITQIALRHTIALFAIAAFLILFSISIRIGLFWFFLVAYFYSAQFLQIGIRHMFFYETLCWILFLFVFFIVGKVTLKFLKKATEFSFTKEDTKHILLRVSRSIIITFSLISLILAILILLRLYQEERVTKIIEHFMSSPTKSVSYEIEYDKCFVVLKPNKGSKWKYLRIDTANIPPSINIDYYKYGADNIIGSSFKNTSIFLVNHNIKSIRFPKELFEKYFKGIYEVKYGDKFPLTLRLIVPENWRKNDLFQRLIFERKYNNEQVGTYVSECCGDIIPLSLEDSILNYDKNISAFQEGGLRIKGVIPSKYSYIFNLPPQRAENEGCFFIRGHLFSQSIQIGLIDSQQHWHNFHLITNAGPFYVKTAANKSGKYTPVVAGNSLESYVDVKIESVGWCE